MFFKAFLVWSFRDYFSLYWIYTVHICNLNTFQYTSSCELYLRTSGKSAMISSFCLPFHSLRTYVSKQPCKKWICFPSITFGREHLGQGRHPAQLKMILSMSYVWAVTGGLYHVMRSKRCRVVQKGGRMCHHRICSLGIRIIFS